MKNIWFLIKQTVREWSEDKATRLSAALSYYTIFSLAPLLVIVIAIAGLAFGQAATQGAIVNQISGLVGQQGAQQVQTMIQNANRPGTGIIATVIGVVILLIGASGVFTQLQDSMNTIWEVKPKPGRGFMAMAKDRFLSFAMVLGIAFLLLVSLVVTAAISAFSRVVISSLPGSAFMIQLINFLISFVVITFLFVLIFKFLPDAHISWKDVWLGGAVTSLLFTIGKMAIGIYLGRSTTASAFGVAGSLIVLLLWIYYSGAILFLGAEFTQVYANAFGHGIQPNENAVWLTEEDRAQQGMPHAEGATHKNPKLANPPAQPSTPVRAVPSRVPVTGNTGLNEQQPTPTLFEAAIPALVALVVGIAGSLAIAREQRHRPLVRKGE